MTSISSASSVISTSVAASVTSVSPTSSVPEVATASEVRTEDRTKDSVDASFQKPAYVVRRENRAKRQLQNKQVLQRHSGQTGVRSSVVMGQSSCDGLRAAPLPQRDFFLSRVHKDDGLEVMEQYIKNKGITCKDLRLTSHVDSLFNSFKLSVVVTDASKIRDPGLWPAGMLIRKWKD